MAGAIIALSVPEVEGITGTEEATIMPGDRGITAGPAIEVILDIVAAPDMLLSEGHIVVADIAVEEVPTERRMAVVVILAVTMAVIVS
jgi:phosphotransacetylase